MNFMVENKCECYYCNELYTDMEYIQCKHNNTIAFNTEELYETCSKKKSRIVEN